VWDVIFQNIDLNHLNNIRIAPNSRFGEVAWYYPTHWQQRRKHKLCKNTTRSLTSGTTAHCHAQRGSMNLSLVRRLVQDFRLRQTTPNYIYQHETSTDADDQVLAANFQTGYFVIVRSRLENIY
jgi:hypothetical protein